MNTRGSSPSWSAGVQADAGPAAAGVCPSSVASRAGPMDTPMSRASHISSSWATWRIACDIPTTPSRRSSLENGSAVISSRGIVSQYDVVCIWRSGRSSSPDPTFSFV